MSDRYGSLSLSKGDIEINQDIVIRALIASICFKTVMVFWNDKLLVFKFLLEMVIIFGAVAGSLYLYKLIAKKHIDDIIINKEYIIFSLMIGAFVPIKMSLAILCVGIFITVFFAKIIFEEIGIADVFNMSAICVVCMDSIYRFRLGADVAIFKTDDVANLMRVDNNSTEILVTAFLIYILIYFSREKLYSIDCAKFIIIGILFVCLIRISLGVLISEPYAIYFFSNNKLMTLKILYETIVSFSIGSGLVGIVLCATDINTAPEYKTSMLVYSTVITVIYMGIVTFINDNYAIFYAIIVGNIVVAITQKYMNKNIGYWKTLAICCIILIAYSVVYYLNIRV